MKKLLQLAFIVIVSFLANSCGKKLSDDLPLPLIRKESVYITTNNNNLISYNAATGTKNWEVILKGISKGVPVLYNQKLYMVTTTGYFYAVDVLTGKIALEKDIAKPCELSLALNGDKLIVPVVDSLCCYNTNGDEVWRYNPSVGSSSSPQVVNGKVFYGAGNRIHCVNASNGAGIWASGVAGGADINSSPRVSNGLVYFGQSNSVIAVNESNGSLKWAYTTNDKITKSSPMVYGGMCIIGSTDFGVYCVDTTSPTFPPNGELRWVFPTAERVSSSPTIHETTNTVLIGGYDFNLYAIDHVSGTLKWKYPAGSIINTSPVVNKDYVYFCSVDRYLYCVDVRNGSTVWKTLINGTTESSPMVDDQSNGQYPGISGMSQY